MNHYSLPLPAMDHYSLPLPAMNHYRSMIGWHSLPEGPNEAHQGLRWVRHSEVRPCREVEVADNTALIALLPEQGRYKLNVV